MGVRPPTAKSIDLKPPAPSRWTVGLHLTVAALSAAVLYVAFPDPGFSLLAHVALAPLFFLAVKSPRPALMLWSSLLAAYAFWLARIAWLTEVTPGGYAALALVMALYTPASLLGIRFLVRRLSFPVTLAAPMVWVSLEFLRGYCPAGGFGWFALSHSQASYAPGQMTPILAQCADIFGEHGVSFLVAMTNGLAVDLVTRPLDRTQLRTRTGFAASSMPGVVLWAACFVAAITYGLFCVARTDTNGDRIRVGVVQTNVPQSNKNHPTAKNMEDDFQRVIGLTFLAASGLDGMAGVDLSSAPDITSTPGAPERPDLIVWPETMVPAGLNPEARAYYADPQSTRFGHDRFYYAIRDLSHELKIPLLVGAPRASDFGNIPSRDGKHFYQLPRERYNSAYLILPEGTAEPLRYDKMHRVPFGEFLPWVEDAPAIKKFFMTNFTPYDYDYSLRPGTYATVFTVNAIDRLRLAEQMRRRTVRDWPASGDDVLRGPWGGTGSLPATQPDVSAATQPESLTQPTTNPTTMAATAPDAVSDSEVVPVDFPRREVRFATPICFEDTVARVCREMAYDNDGNKRIDVLVNLTNDGWYPSWAQGRQHLQIATLRCIENRVPMARSVNTGVSGFITSLGQVVQLVQDHNGKRQEVEGFSTLDMTMDKRSTIFGRIGHWPVAILIVITGVLFFVAVWRGEPKREAVAAAGRSN